MSVLTNVERIGAFTSSEIYSLVKKDRSGKGFGAPALSYIQEKNMERRLGRSIKDESKARPLVWGKLLEEHAFNKLGFDYNLKSQDTIVHPEFDFWCGTPDVTKQDTVADIKCPITLKSFCQMVDDGFMELIRVNHSDGEKYYWQLVSNAILTDSRYAELIVYMPYKSDLKEIRQLAMMEDAANWIVYADDNELPYLIDGGYYQDINIISFEVPLADKLLLRDCVERAGEMLIKI